MSKAAFPDKFKSGSAHPLVNVECLGTGANALLDSHLELHHNREPGLILDTTRKHDTQAWSHLVCDLLEDRGEIAKVRA